MAYGDAIPDAKSYQLIRLIFQSRNAKQNLDIYPYL
jgi:hypothetical protein